jgi:glutathione S-transferase
MRIHDFPFAPNPRKLRIYLAEKGIEIPFVMVNIVQGEHRQEAFLARNPMGGVPVLELDDGSFLSESLAIIEYLEELYPEPPMIGRSPIERARVRRLERIAEMGVLARVARYVHAAKSPLPHVAGDPALAAQMLVELPLPLGVLEAEAAGREFVAGDHPTIADCTLFAAAAFAGFAALDLFDGYPALSSWLERFMARPSTAIRS